MKPLQLDFKPSIILTLIISAMASGAFIILILSPLLLMIKLLLGLAIFSATVYAVCLHALLLLPWSCVGLTVSSHNQLTLLLANSGQLPAQICHDSVVTPYFTVVNCRVKDASLVTRLLARKVVILPDMLDKESYRQFRVWVRWGNVFNS